MSTAQVQLNYIRWFDELGNTDVPLVGGKNASLGELTQQLGGAGVRVPEGFATTAEAFWLLLDQDKLKERIHNTLERMDGGELSLSEAGWRVRRMILQQPLPAALADEITVAYERLCAQIGRDDAEMSVRSSATAEDLPDASFAGQQETYLNIRGVEPLLDACQRCFASLFTDRAISYREQKGFEHGSVALSIGIQRMVRSDQASSGVMFSIDTETGFPDVAIINAAWGLGETVVQGSVDPDEYVVYKPLLESPGRRPILSRSCGSKRQKMIYARGGGRTTKVVNTNAEEQQSLVLSDDEILELARWAAIVEDHYGCPMDMEWAKDGLTGELFMVQARPETVQSRKAAHVMTTFTLKTDAAPVLTGTAVGDAICSGKVIHVHSQDEMDAFKPGHILVTAMTDPDWVPLMKHAAGIITDHGGRTCHAAIVSRELGIPAVVGTTHATHQLQTGDDVTLSCAGGSVGQVFAGQLPFESDEVDLSDFPETKTAIMMNIGTPGTAFHWWRLPTDGVGLARMEFIISNDVKIHPMALLQPDRVDDPAALAEIERLTQGYSNRGDYFVDHLAAGIARIAASQYPRPVIVRMSDFKTNEYADLIGGHAFEPEEHNPMLGFRGASRYYAPDYRPGFELECRAIRRVREQIGLNNVIVMIPFCRTLAEADRVLQVMAECGLERGRDGLQVYVMAEIPANIILAEEFARRFDGFSIGSNDLTQLVLGIDRDSEQLAPLFDERNEAVVQSIQSLIATAHRCGSKVGICGQAPSDHDGFAEQLVAAGIDSISLTPDKILDVRRRVAAVET